MTKVLFFSQLLFCSSVICLSSCTSTDNSAPAIVEINLQQKNNLPEKKIFLSELGRFEYFQPPVHEDYLYTQIHYVSKDKMVVSDWNSEDIMLFAGDGRTPVSKINYKGQGAKEYSSAGGLIYNDESGEIMIPHSDKIQVYKFESGYQRTIPLLKGASPTVSDYDDKCLLLHDRLGVYPAPFVLISKTDGVVVDSLPVPKDNYVDLMGVSKRNGMTTMYYAPTSEILRFRDGFLLNNSDIDTVYYHNVKTKETSPYIVKYPPVQSMKPLFYLYGGIETQDYLFIASHFVAKLGEPEFKHVYMIRDKKSGELFSSVVELDDYEGSELSITPSAINKTESPEILLFSLDLETLRDANEEGRLKGELKALVENSPEEGNDINVLLYLK